MIKKRAERIRSYREMLKPGARHDERPLKSEMLKRKIAALDARIDAAHTAEAAARAAEAENTLEGKRNLAARELRQALAEERGAELREQAGEAREHAGALERQAVKVDHALQGFLKEYLALKDDIEHARQKGWMPWTTAATTVCNRALKTALLPIPEFEIRPLSHPERKCFSEIGLSFGDAVRGAAVRLEQDPGFVPVGTKSSPAPNGEKTE